MNRQEGSALLLALFTCLALAALILSAAAVTGIFERALEQESVGRGRAQELERHLATVTSGQARHWSPAVVGLDDQTRATIEEEGGEISGAWRLRLRIEQESRWLQAGLERAQDGLDIPVAALVATDLRFPPERDLPVVAVPPEHSATVALLSSAVPPPLDSGVDLRPLEEPWHLEEGSLRRLESSGLEAVSSLAAVAEARTMQTIRLAAMLASAEPGLGSPERPCLVVVHGGGTLDARDLGQLHAVLVVEGGDVLLDGTIVYGAVFATGTVGLGESGMIVYSESTLRWATDGSLTRVRLVPGTWAEGATGG